MDTISIATKLTQKAIRRGRRKSFTSQARAREIMGQNFFGVEEAIKHFGISPSKREVALLADVPFSEKAITDCKWSHTLAAVFPLSILEIRSKVDRNLFSCGCFDTFTHPDSTHDDTWLNKQEFANDRGEIGWHLVRNDPVPNSTEKTLQHVFRLFQSRTPACATCRAS